MIVKHPRPIFYRGRLYDCEGGHVELPDDYMEVLKADKNFDPERVVQEPDPEKPYMGDFVPGRNLSRAGTEGTLEEMKDRIASLEQMLAQGEKAQSESGAEIVQAKEGTEPETTEPLLPGIDKESSAKGKK